MRAVHKFKLSLLGEGTTVSMPAGAEVLSVHVQYETVCLWALVDTDKPPEPRSFLVCGTGQEAPSPDHRFVGTVLMYEGTLVLHVFEAPRA